MHKKNLFCNFHIFFLEILIFETFRISHFSKRFVLFPHVASQEQILKHNLGLSAQSKSRLCCARMQFTEF